MITRARGELAIIGAIFLTAGTSFAADLPRQVAAPVYAPRPATFTWAGFYIGANAGYATQLGKDYDLAVRPGYFPSSPSTVGTIRSQRNSDGFLAGGQVGYNYQIGNLVVGAENDIQYLKLGKNKGGYTFSGTGAVPSDFNYVGPEKTTNYFATGRARIGYAFDRFLVFGSAGLAYGQLKSRNCLGSKCDEGKVGFAAGAGLEYALSRNWSVKVEGLYVNLGKAPAGVIGTDAIGRTYVDGRKVENDIALVRAGVNYRF